MTESDFLVSLFGPFAPTFTPLEARLVAQALSRLPPAAPRLTFELAFDAVLLRSHAGGGQYAAIAEAQARLTQPLPYQTLALDHRRTEHLVLFASLRVDEGTERISGEFNPRLGARWRQLTGELTAAELEALLPLRGANRPRPS
ncbi:MAG TPA: hypothetical protein VF629_07210 [Hymenobacter sp.]|jgi:hypothetical protein|uniref:hypothetical protein n=1 Tax=Hymenobacter sp. TaxID=1898978 RepID=UPI002EDB4B38